VVLVGMKSTIARYTAFNASPRDILLDPLAKLVGDGAIAAAVFCPGPDYRRVTRELWPQLPGVLAPLRAELVDEWLYIEAAINSPPDPRPRLTLQAKDAASAEVFAKLWRDLPVAVTQFGGNDQSRQFAKEAARLFVDSMPADVQGARATVRIPTDERQLTKLSEMFADATDKSQQVYLRKHRLVQFKNMATSMLIFESEHRHFPTAICDKDGRPLLSWRVAILPNIGQKALYDEFHLDEPWDSPHNKPLVAKMPDVFVDSDSKLSQAAQDGKTTYQLPVGPQTIFFDNNGTKVSQITDGLQRTILIVEVEPSRAVEWTRPSDWEVELDNPKAGLVRDRGVVTAAYADGHVELLNLDKTSDKQLGALLTRAGGDNSQQ
jgi:prepilin-type processing-associated H-X9-DG protein